MKRLIALCTAVAISTPLAAQTYKWVDERGVTNYGEKPPVGRRAQPVDTIPNGTIESNAGQQRKEETGARPWEGAAAPPPPAPSTPAPAVASVRGMNFDTFARLQRGMTEGELLLRAGPPDYATVEYHPDIVKLFYYYPTVADPFITVVTLRGGRIANLERNRKFY